MNDVMLRTPPYMMSLGDSIELVIEEPTDPYDVPSFEFLLMQQARNVAPRQEEPTLKSAVPPPRKLGLWARLVEYVWAFVWGLVTR